MYVFHHFSLIVFLGFYSIIGHASDPSVEVEADLSTEVGRKKRPEDNIPVIEIRGEGKPMTAAQIRQLEESANGGPLNIKVEKTWKPFECNRAAKRKDFITFHYKTFTESGKKCDQSYGREPIRLQLGVGMMMPGLDKGIKGMCDTELRKIQIPYRLSRKRKSKIWKNIPNDEHWLTFNIEMLLVESWTPALQFQFLDLNNDTYLTENELVKFQEKMKKNFGKTWSNNDIDQIVAAKYYIKYFDANGDNKINMDEFTTILKRDMTLMEINKDKKFVGKKRDPAIAWILDFNNDGIVSVEENDEAAEILENGPLILPTTAKDEL